MAVPEHIAAQIRAYIAEVVVPLLPEEIQVVTFDVVSWHIKVHMYQYEILNDLEDDRLEQTIERLAGTLAPRSGEPWLVTSAFHRGKPSSAFATEGEIAYAV